MRTTQLTGATTAHHGTFFSAHHGTALVSHLPSLSFQATPCSTHPWGMTTRKTRTEFRIGSSSPHSGVTQSMMSLFSGWGGSSSPAEEVPILHLPLLEAPDVAVVWFTASDLRVHDHDGLVAAAGASAVLPVYVFDDQELAAESPLDATFIYHALHDLQKSLRSLGSDLVVRSGDVDQEVARLVEQAGASHVFFHTSPVHSLRHSHQKVKSSLASLDLPGNGSRDSPSVQLSSWSAAQLTGVENNDPSRAWNFREFERMTADDGQPARSAFPPPASLPPLPSNVEPGDLPSLDDVIARVGSPDERIKRELSKASLQEAPFGTRRLCVAGFGESWARSTLDDYLSMGDEDFARSVFGPEHGNEDLLREETGLEAAATRRIVRARGYGGLAPGEALARAMGVALALGCVSPRRMFLAHRRARNGGVMGALGSRPPKKCWARELASRESWHVLLAMRDVTVGNGFSRRGAMEHRYLRWHGWLVRYAVGGSPDPSHPTALLVHGFGASSDQWDRVFEEFTATSPNHYPSSLSERPGGLRLLALDLVGFGHSAKPPVTYSQYYWADCARDVALRVEGGPFFVAGNSIGGYISMGLAAECRELCQGVVLINSAGRILTAEKFEAEMTTTYKGLNVEDATRAGKLGTYVALPNAALALFGTGLLTFLQGRIAKICRNVHPVNPDIVDEGLAENILRDSCDPGAGGVIAAGGKLPFSRSANEMLGKFGGPVLVTQGVKDPLNDAEGRATSFEALGPQVEVVRLDGGHCPHHEVATEVCRAMYRFIERVQTGELQEVLAQTT